MAVGVMCLTACAQKKGGERGPRQGGHMEINKDSDSSTTLRPARRWRITCWFLKV